jgi:hypothetical protein
MTKQVCTLPRTLEEHMWPLRALSCGASATAMRVRQC